MRNSAIAIGLNGSGSAARHGGGLARREAFGDNVTRTPIRKRTFPVWAIVLAAVICAYMAIVQRVHVVKAAPAAAGLFQVIGLPVNIYNAEIVNVRATLVSEGAESRLVVDGHIRNLKPANNTIPDVQISLGGDRGATVYSWVAKLPQKTIKQGETLAFKTSLDAPPVGIERIVLGFAPQ